MLKSFQNSYDALKRRRENIDFRANIQNFFFTLRAQSGHFARAQTSAMVIKSLFRSCIVNKYFIDVKYLLLKIFLIVTYLT